MTESVKSETPFDDQHSLSDEDFVLIDLYLDTNVPIDALAYTSRFDELYEKYIGKYPGHTKAEVFRRLLSLRKRGQLPRLGRNREAS